MIRLWTSAHSSATLREQLGAQLLLGILSGRLAPGERLPSIRALAKRLRIHPNTIASVYRELAARGWVRTRPGSGVFIRDEQRTGDGVAAFVSEWVAAAERRGFTPDELEAELRRRQSSPAIRHLLAVDSDGALAEIIAAEISAALAQPVAWVETTQIAAVLRGDSRVFVSTGSVAKVAPILGTHPFEPVRLKSMPDFLTGLTKPDRPMLIGVVSHSATVLAWAPTLLAALGFSSESILLRNPAAPEWREGLRACDIVAADVCAARHIPKGLKPILFQIVNVESLASLSQPL